MEYEIVDWFVWLRIAFIVAYCEHGNELLDAVN